MQKGLEKASKLFDKANEAFSKKILEYRKAEKDLGMYLVGVIKPGKAMDFGTYTPTDYMHLPVKAHQITIGEPI